MTSTAAAKTTYRITLTDGTAKTFKSSLDLRFALIVTTAKGDTVWAKSSTREGVEAKANADAHHIALIGGTVTIVPVVAL